MVLCITLLPMILVHTIQCIYMMPAKKNSELCKYSVLACLVCLLTIKAEAFCGEKTFLSSTDGRLVVLHPVVAESEELSIILWIRDDLTEIATIRYRNESVDIQCNGNSDKVNISRDGSLIINNFTMEDQGTYIVVIKQINQSDCNHTYYVSMSEKSPCENTKDIEGREEEEITLPLEVDRAQLKIVYWFSPRGDLLAKTKPGGYIQPQSDYDRRLKTRADGSLNIPKLTIKDQGIYVAKVHLYSGRSCLQIYNVTISGVIPERAKTKRVNVFSYEEQNVTLQLPEHLVEVEDIFWMRDNAKHIATTFKNGSLHILDSRYQEKLHGTSNGSLIILDLRVEDRGKYSADIHLINKELYTEIYYLSIHRKSYYITHGIRNVSATEGEDLIFQNYVKEIKSIDWITPRWIRFAVTKLGGDICILEQSYSDRLFSLNDGSITIKKVTKQEEGIYRAHMFSRDGMLLEQQYHVLIYEDQTALYVLYGVVGLLILICLLIMYCCCHLNCRVRKSKKKFYMVTEIAQGLQHNHEPVMIHLKNTTNENCS